MPSNQTLIDDLEPIAESGRLTVWVIDFLTNVRYRLDHGDAISSWQGKKLSEIHIRHCR